MPELTGIISVKTWFYLEIFFSVSFTIEFILRLFSWNAFNDKTYLSFIKNPFTIIDLMAILPL